MALARPRVAPTIRGLPQVQPAARAVPAFASPRGGGPKTVDIVDFGAISQSLVRFLLPQARARGQQEAAKGEAFVKENPAFVAQIEAQAREVAGEDDMEAIRETFNMLVASGRAPEASSPFFQIKFVEMRARAQAAAVRSDLLQRLPELTQVSEDEDPPNMDQVFAEAFAEAAASPSARSVYGQAAFNGARSQVEDEIGRRFDEQRTANITAQARSLYRDEVGARLAKLAAVNPEDQDEAQIDLAQKLQEGTEGTIRDVRGLVLEALVEQTATIARDDVDKAVWLARQARMLAVNGKQLGEEGSFSAGQLDTLIHELSQQRDEKQRNENSLRLSNQRVASEIVRGIAGPRFKDALADPERTVEGELQALRRELDENPELLALMGRSPGEGLGNYKGIALNEMQSLADGYKRNSGQDDPERVQDLRRQMKLGLLTDEEVTAEARALFLSDDMSVATFDGLLEELGSSAAVRRLTTQQGSPFKGVLSRLDEGLIQPGFSVQTQIELSNSRQNAEDQVHAIVTAAVDGAGDSPAEQEKAFNAALASKEVSDIWGVWQQSVATKAGEFSKLRSDVNTALANFDADKAEELIRGADGSTLNADQVPAQLRDVDRNRAELDQLMNGSPFLTKLQAEVRTATTLALREQKLLSEPAINDAALKKEQDATARWKALVRSGDLSSRTRQDTFAAAGQTALEEATADFRAPGQAVATSLVEAGRAGLTNESNKFAAALVRGPSATETITSFFEPFRLDDEVETGLYGLVDDFPRTRGFFDELVGPLQGEFVPFEDRSGFMLRKWDGAALQVPANRRGHVYASLHMQHFIPYEAVLGGTITLDETLSFRDLGIESSGRTGVFGKASDIEAVRKKLGGPNTEISFHPVSRVAVKTDGIFGPTEQGGIVRMKAEVAFAPDVQLSPYGTQYFRTVGAFDDLDEGLQKRFLQRLGFGVEGDAFIESKTLFRDDQIQVIADWDRRKGVE